MATITSVPFTDTLPAVLLVGKVIPAVAGKGTMIFRTPQPRLRWTMC